MTAAESLIAADIFKQPYLDKHNVLFYTVTENKMGQMEAMSFIISNLPRKKN